VRSIAISMSVCLSVYGSACSLAYLKNRKCRLGEIFCMFPVAVGRSSSDDSVICNALAVQRITLFFNVTGQIQIQAWSLRSSELFTMTRQVAALNCSFEGEVCYRRLPRLILHLCLRFRRGDHVGNFPNSRVGLY